MGDRTGMYVMGGRLFFPWYESSCALTATRSPPVLPVVAAVIAPGAEQTRQTIDINDFHVSYALGHALSLGETARQLGITLTGELFPCSGCSMEKGKQLPTKDHIFSLHSATATSVRRPVWTAAGAIDWGPAVHHDCEG